MKRITGAVAGALLAASSLASPALAQSSEGVSAARAGAELQDASEMRGGFIIPLVAIVAVLLGILALAGGDGDPPTSP